MKEKKAARRLAKKQRREQRRQENGPTGKLKDVDKSLDELLELYVTKDTRTDTKISPQESREQVSQENRRIRRSKRLQHQKEARDKRISSFRDIPSSILEDDDDLEEDKNEESGEESDDEFAPRIPSKVSRKLRKKANKLADDLVSCLSLR